MKLLEKLKYSDDTKNAFRKYIYFRAISTTIRGFYYSLFKSKSRGMISVGKNVTIIGPRERLRIGKLSRLEENVYIQTISKQGITIGDDVTICFGTQIRPSGHWGGLLGEGMRIGNHSCIGAYSYIGCAGFIEIGENVLIGPNIYLIAENHNFGNSDATIKEQGMSRKGIRIGNNIWIGANSKIIDGVTIGDNSIVGAGSVLTKSIPPNCIYAGVPARLIKER
jgi:acetyltransferase-like isoleucine patch superfamily enzyme